MEEMEDEKQEAPACTFKLIKSLETEATVQLEPVENDHLWAAPLGVPGVGVDSEDFKVFLSTTAYSEIYDHTKLHRSQEVGGILLGFLRKDEESGKRFIEVMKTIPARKGEEGVASFKFTTDALEHIHHKRDTTYPELQILGWYHSHPNFGVFLSKADQFIQSNFFPREWQVAIVVDPVRNEVGVFNQRNGNVKSVTQVYICGLRKSSLYGLDTSKFIEENKNYELIAEYETRAEVRNEIITTITSTLDREFKQFFKQMLLQEEKQYYHIKGKKLLKNSIKVALIIFVFLLINLIALLMIQRYNIQQQNKRNTEVDQAVRQVKETTTQAQQLYLERLKQMPGINDLKEIQKLINIQQVMIQTLLDETKKKEEELQPTPTAIPEATRFYPKGDEMVIIIAPGDTLTEICLNYYGNSTWEFTKLVAEYNGLEDPNKIRIGSEIYLPPKERLYTQNK